MSTQAGKMDQRRKLQGWAYSYKNNNQVIDLNSKVGSEESKIASQPHNEFVAFSLSTLQNLQMPAPHKDEPNRATRYEYATVARITLLSMKSGFFGRTYQSSHISLDPTTLKPVGDKINEFALFYSKFKDKDLHAIVEFVLIIKEKSAHQQAASAVD